MPGETAIVVGGVVAERGEVELAPLIGLVWVAAVGGDVVSFLLGRRFGRPFLDAHGERLRIRAEHVERVERIFDRHGGKAILVGRFVGILRALMPFVAGASRFPLRRFVPYTAVGSARLGGDVHAGRLRLFRVLRERRRGRDSDRARRGARRRRRHARAAVRSGRKRGTAAHQPQRHERGQGAERRPDEAAGEHVEREVHAQVDARQRDRGGEPEGVGTHPRADDRDGGGSGEGGRGVTGREGGVVGIGTSDPSPGSASGGRSRSNSSLRGETTSDALSVAASAAMKASGRRRRPTSQPRPSPTSSGPLTHHADSSTHRRREQRRLDDRGHVHESAIELEELRHHDQTDGSSAPRLLLVVNARASGVEDPQRTAAELVGARPRSTARPPTRS